MAEEAVPSGVQSDGKWRITNVPSGSNARSVAILNGATAKPITYGFTADGWDHQKTQASVDDKRLTLKQNLARPGRVDETLTVTAVASSDVGSADRILAGLSTSGAESQFVVRRAVDNDATHAVGQIVDIITGVVGIRRPQAPTENGLDTAQYTVFITKPTQTDVALVA